MARARSIRKLRPSRAASGSVLGGGVAWCVAPWVGPPNRAIRPLRRVGCGSCATCRGCGHEGWRVPALWVGPPNRASPMRWGGLRVGVAHFSSAPAARGLTVASGRGSGRRVSSSGACPVSNHAAEFAPTRSRQICGEPLAPTAHAVSSLGRRRPDKLATYRRSLPRLQRWPRAKAPRASGHGRASRRAAWAKPCLAGRPTAQAHDHREPRPSRDQHPTRLRGRIALFGGPTHGATHHARPTAQHTPEATLLGRSFLMLRARVSLTGLTTLWAHTFRSRRVLFPNRNSYSSRRSFSQIVQLTPPVMTTLYCWRVILVGMSPGR